MGASLQGASLHEACLQGANLNGAHLGGATTGDFYSDIPFPERIRKQIDKPSNFGAATFAGDLTEGKIYSITQGLDYQQATVLREKLNPHINKPASKQLPENSGANTRTYSSKDAEKWIAEYENAMAKDKDRS